MDVVVELDEHDVGVRYLALVRSATDKSSGLAKGIRREGPQKGQEDPTPEGKQPTRGADRGAIGAAPPPQDDLRILFAAPRQP